jgi:hypothetical protein
MIIYLHTDTVRRLACLSNIYYLGYYLLVSNYLVHNARLFLTFNTYTLTPVISLAIYE